MAQGFRCSFGSITPTLKYSFVRWTLVLPWIPNQLSLIPASFLIPKQSYSKNHLSTLFVSLSVLQRQLQEGNADRERCSHSSTNWVQFLGLTLIAGKTYPEWSDSQRCWANAMPLFFSCVCHILLNLKKKKNQILNDSKIIFQSTFKDLNTWFPPNFFLNIQINAEFAYEVQNMNYRKLQVV